MKSAHLRTVTAPEPVKITDIPLQPASQDIWDKKYRLKTKEGQPIDTDVEVTYQRVAHALADVEATPELREHWYERFLWALRQGAIPAGRIISNAGALAHKPATSTINCTVSGTIGDSMDNILHKVHEAGLTLKAGSGIGYEFSTLRPRGAYVSGAGAYTSGPLSFMDIYDKMCFTVSSAGGRRGAQMGTFDIGHPDVLEFIRAKRENGRLRQFNLSLLITEEFMQAVNAGTDWPLAFPLRKNELDDSIDLDNPEHVIWREWPIHDDLVVRTDGKVACKIYRTVPAQRLWDLIMNSTYDYAEPGFILIDTVNEMNNNWWCETIRASNPCVTADTWVHTSEGPRQVRKLIGKGFIARIDGQDHVSSPEGFFFTARKRVFRLETKQGFSLKLTSDHQILKVTGYAHGKPTTQWCAAGELQRNDKILLNNHRTHNKWPGRFGDIEGIVLGQAFIAAKCHEPYKLYATKGSNAAKLEPLNYSSNENDLAFLILDFTDDFGLKSSVPVITPAIENTSSDFYGGFLRGVFEKNAGLSQDKFSGYSIRLKMPTVALLKGIQRMLLRLGIVSNIHASQKELYIAGDNLKEFENSVGFDSDEKRHALYDAIESCSEKLFHERFTAIVQSVIEDGIEEVYDVQVPGIHCFDANGLHAHNCGEQMLPPYGSCLLGSINLTQFVRDPFTDRAGFDWEGYRETVAVFTRMLDNVVEINGLPLEQQRHEILTKRRHGMGYLGLGSTLTMLRMKYGEPDSLTFTEQVTQEMAVTGWRTGLALAREKGPAPIMEQEFEITSELLRKRPEMVQDGLKAGDRLPGKILHARYSRYMQQVAAIDPELVKALAETGCRFTHHTSIAPTGTISLSLANNASNGIEPSFAHHYSRNVIREGRKSKEKVDVFSFELLAYRELINPRAVPYSDKPEEQLPDYFITADDISPKQHVDIQAAAQKWIDSSISKTANVPTHYPYEEFKNIYRYAYEQGLKGCTTFRFNPEAFQGVLVKEQDLENTQYTFVLEDDSEVTVKGNEPIEYDGEIHTAANLFDALKEGYYGRY